ncbi:MAG TPA: condensation domain-containing protein, partial [Longimicrobiaceae bacterium]
MSTQPESPVIPDDAFVFPLSFAQQRLWFIDQLEPGSTVYNIPAAIHLEGRLDVEAMERALGEIVRRHEALRTTFVVVDREPVQVVHPWKPVPFPVLDLTGEPEETRRARAVQWTYALATRSFDLAAGPLIAVELLRVAPEEHVLMVVTHHIVSDGWSLGVFLGELRALYGAYAAGAESPLPELEIQYADFAVWQRETLVGEELERQIAYWRDRLGDAPVLDLATDRPRPPMQTFNGGVHLFEMRGGLMERLRTLGNEERGTLFMVLLAAWQVLLSRYTGQEDVVVGSPIANRNRREVEELIGFFVNTLALRGDLSGNPSFREVLR